MRALAVALSMAMLAASQEPQPPRATFKSAVISVPVDVSVVDRERTPCARSHGAGLHPVGGRQAAPDRVGRIHLDRRHRRGRARQDRRIQLQRGGRRRPADHARRGLPRTSASAAARPRSRPRAGLSAPSTAPTASRSWCCRASGRRWSSRRIMHSCSRCSTRSPGAAPTSLGPRRVGLSEALALQGNDRTAVRDIVARECGSRNPPPTLIESCLQRIQGEAAQLLLSARERSRNSLVALRGLFDRMDTGNTPKTIVLHLRGHAARFAISPTSRGSAPAPRPRTSSSTSCSSTPPRSSRRLNGCRTSQTADRTVLKHGLDQLAAQARGEVFRIFGDADFAFQRLGRELSGYYLLSFEPERRRPRRQRLTRSRSTCGGSNLELRSRREFSVGPPVALTTDEMRATGAAHADTRRRHSAEADDLHVPGSRIVEAEDPAGGRDRSVAEPAGEPQPRAT